MIVSAIQAVSPFPNAARVRALVIDGVVRELARNDGGRSAVVLVTAEPSFNVTTLKPAEDTRLPAFIEIAAFGQWSRRQIGALRASMRAAGARAVELLLAASGGRQYRFVAFHSDAIRDLFTLLRWQQRQQRCGTPRVGPFGAN